LLVGEYKLYDIVEMKKEHPCHKSKDFQIVRLGSDIKLKCQGCGAIVFMSRSDFVKKAKKIVLEAKDE